MPKIVRASPAADAAEERTIRKLAGARHAPADWILRARIVCRSWDGLRVPVTAEQLGCHEQTVRRWLVRFNTAGVDGVADLGGQGRKRRITEAERSRLIGLVKQPPAGQDLRCWWPAGSETPLDVAGYTRMLNTYVFYGGS